MSVAPEAPRDPAREAALDALEARQREEAPVPGAIVERETRRVRIPPGGALPRSSALLDRYHGGPNGDFAPREKKPMVVDTRRSHGPFMVSVDDAPLAILDACSQIATLTHGFGHPAIVRGMYEGRFDRSLWANTDTTVHHVPELAAYADALLRLAPPALTHVSFVGAGGAEANEKALRLARLHAPPTSDGRPRRRVLAFKDSFHGRTLATLAATWNPEKRAPFEMAGHEAIFCEATLPAVERALASHHDELYCVLVEPMMAEGGDVHLAREFLLGLCRLVRAQGLALLVDEVQTGFATGGPFFWWQRLGLGGDDLTAPDLLTCAKKAGVGVVLSRWPDPEQNQVCVVSALRGLIHLETAREQAPLEALLQPRMQKLGEMFPELVSNIRVAGTTCAFDLPDAAAQNAFINQRYPRGFMTYPAGTRTIRFRFSASWDERHLDDLFARVAEDLRRLYDPDALLWVAEGQQPEIDETVVVRAVAESDWPAIMAIEHDAYEPARRDSEAYLRGAATAGLGLVACDGASGEVLGFCFGAPIETFRDVSGPDQDDRMGRGDSFYSADITVAGTARARGVGRMLKRAQVQWARERGFSFVSGRNRVGATDAMAALNRSFGAFPVARLTHQYEGNAQADYYRIPLVPPSAPPTIDSRVTDLASGLQAPFGPRPEFMATRELVGPCASRINLSNYVTIDLVHYSELLQQVTPRGTGHMYMTTSRDEMVDKSIRCLRLGRPKGQVAVGLEGGYLGHVTAAARSLSDPRGFGPDFGFFEWPRLPHPAGPGGPEATVRALDELVARVGAEVVLGLYAEVVGERSGLVLEGEGARMLADACRRHDIPLVLVEAASGGYRGAAEAGGVWGVDTLPAEVVPDVVLWYPGGQIGHIFVGDRYYIKKPLVLISTWDGDEMSAIRAHEHLRAARKHDLAAAAATLDATLRAGFSGSSGSTGSSGSSALAGARLGGLGLYRSVTLADVNAAEAVYQACRHHGLLLGRGLPGTLIFAPPLDAGALLGGPLRDMLAAALPDAPELQP